jgi:Zn finger protein HypA/HybF involved in hydrogenase expression
MNKVIVENDSSDFPCTGCGETLRFLWPPQWHLSTRAVVVTCPTCKGKFEVGGENSVVMNLKSV